jgi:glycosyltransferase involved in cell wall biosynthesis
MKIVYIHQHFMTNKGSAGTRSYDVARYMVQAGHSVNMITGIYDISGLAPMPWYKLFRRENIDGIEITVCNVPYSNKLGMVKRMWAFLWFAFLATIAALKTRKVDLVFATSTPLTVGIPGYIAAACKQVLFIFEVRDMWPEAFIRAGWVTGKELHIKIMAWLEKFIYDHADKIMLVSPGFEKRLIERGFPAEKMKTVLLGADGELFKEVKPDSGFIKRYNLQGKTIAIFTGAHGKTNGLYYVLDAAENTKDRPDIAYVLIGDGSEKQRLIETAEKKGLDNVVFAALVPKKDLPGILAVCHIGLMILRYIGEPRPVTPNKIFDYMFMAMPSLVNFEGPTIDMVRADGSGLYVDPRDPRDLADKVKLLADSPDLRKKLGESGRKAAWQKYDRKIIAEQLIKTFEEVILSKKQEEISSITI